MKHIILCLAAICFLTQTLLALPLSEDDYGNIRSYTTAQHVIYETYLDTGDDIAGVIGYHFDTFFHPEYYVLSAIFGAVTGGRGGYGIAAVGLGQRKTLSKKWILDSKAFLGSGGGGGLPAGGGFMWEVQTGLSYAIGSSMYLDSKIGYLSFPTGTFSTPIISLGFCVQTRSLYLPYK
jgi:hypothetical protein